jgi:HPt (histidine-containing phosphotransfer) domain-containing protein
MDHGIDDDDVFMEELKQQFRENVAENLTKLESLLKENKFPDIATIAHDIKGTAGLFGFDEGADIAKKLQLAAQDGDTDQTRTLMGDLTEYMKKVDVLPDS